MEKFTSFENIVEQYGAVRILKFFIAKNAIHRTLLFSGIDGIGKKKVAMAFAAACICQNKISDNHGNNSKNLTEEMKVANACNSCRDCKMVAKGCHPNVLQIGFKDTNIITISDIRNLLDKVSIKPYGSGDRVVIMPQADRMTNEASNIFFRFLDAHVGKITIVLTTTSQMDLAPEIISYCHIIRFKPINLFGADHIPTTDDFGDEVSKTMLNLPFGSLSKIKDLSFQNLNDRRKWLIAKMDSICFGNEEEVKMREIMVLSEILSNHPNTIGEYFTIIILWLRDLLIYKLDPKKIYNLDIKKNISITSKRVDYSDILYKISIVQTAEQEVLKANINLRLLIETMLIESAN